MKIVVLSGKGGVGKSSITASLAVLLSRSKKVVCADCDVDASNLPLVLGSSVDETYPIKASRKAVVSDACTGCKKCFEACYFNAIEWDGKPVITGKCEGCGTCAVVCPAKAITLESFENAILTIGSDGIDIVAAQLKIGESGSGKIVNIVKETAEKRQHDILLIDAAAGVGCPVIASVKGADKAILVVEPTPTSFADMQRANNLLDHFNISRMIVINKSDIGETKDIYQFAKENNIPVVAELPYDKRFVQALVNLNPAVLEFPELEKYFSPILASFSKK
ncbi:MAG: ATP-binding protein [Candidatus Woesearchaeota archaeon]